MTDPGDKLQKPVTRPLHLWLMRLTAMILIPAVFIGGLELLLRVSGYGHSTDYFVPSRVGEQDFLIPNYSFSHRFFPSDLARTPVRFRIPVEKPMGTFRIFIFGASAALGDPDPNYGFGAYLEERLELRYAGTDFEVINTSMTAINSHVVLPIARECANLNGDLWIVYLGNNEMVGPFGAGTIFGKKAPSLAFVRTSLLLKATRLGQLMMNILSLSGGDSAEPEKWTGIDMFKDNQIRHDDPARLKVYENFKGNLEDILSLARKAKVPVILSTVGSNLKDCAPFASLHREDLAPEMQAVWAESFERGRALEIKGDFEGALQAYEKAVSIDPEYAELQYRIGRCLLATGKTETALEHLLMARDHDALAVRADKRINEILRAVSVDRSGAVVTADAERFLTEASSSGIPGEAFFYEHVHLTPEGNYHLAKCISDTVSQQLPDGFQGSKAANWSGRTVCNQRLALTLWDQLRLWQEMADRIKESPFNEQSGHSDNIDYMEMRMASLKSRVTNSTFIKDRALYEAATRRNASDTMLMGNYAQFLDGNGRTGEAIVIAEKIRDLLPDFGWTHYYLGALLAKDGRLDEAEKSLQNALELNDELNQARQVLKAIKRQRLRKLLNPSNP